MLDDDDLIARLRKLKPEMGARYRARKIELFGSRARGESTKDSDIDILVEFDDGADLVDFVGLATFLEDKLGQKVDVVSKRALRQELRESILANVIPV